MAQIRVHARARRLLVVLAAVGITVPVAGVVLRDDSTTVGAASSPTFAAGSAGAVEGDSKTRTAYLPVTLSDRATNQVTVQYAVTAGSATAGPDFKVRSGTLTFAAGGAGTPVRKLVAVTVNSDTTPESSETFTLTLSNATGGAVIGRATGTGTIIDDDPGTGVRIGVGDAAIAEGDTGPSRPATIAVTLSNTATSTVSVGYQLAAGTASAGSDFIARSGTITFRPGQWKKSVVGVVVADTEGEVDETAIVTLTNPSGATINRSTGTLAILDDDGGVPPNGPDATVVAAAGDLGSSASDLAPVANQIQALDPDFAMALGDIVYPDGQASGFDGFFDETWGQFRSRIIAVPGNHDYHTSGASGFFGYFDQPAYFARDIGTDGWRVYALNCEIDCSAGSPQAAFVDWDIANFPDRHRLAIVHRPRFTSTQNHGDYAGLATIWDSLAADGGEVMLAGHNHVYERFARMTGSGTVSSSGMRQFVVGTGGRDLYSFGSLHAGEEFRGQHAPRRARVAPGRELLHVAVRGNERRHRGRRLASHEVVRDRPRPVLPVPAHQLDGPPGLADGTAGCESGHVRLHVEHRSAVDSIEALDVDPTGADRENPACGRPEAVRSILRPLRQDADPRPVLATARVACTGTHRLRVHAIEHEGDLDMGEVREPEGGRSVEHVGIELDARAHRVPCIVERFVPSAAHAPDRPERVAIHDVPWPFRMGTSARNTAVGPWRSSCETFMTTTTVVSTLRSRITSAVKPKPSPV